MLWLSLIACNAPPEASLWNPSQQINNPIPADRGGSEDAPRGFSWVVDDVLAAMPYPRDLPAVRAEGVETLVSLTLSPLYPQALEEADLLSVHLPIQDFQGPTLDQAYAFVSIVEAGQQVGSPVGVHCMAGVGRAGTLSAIWFVYQGQTADEALATIRDLRPGSVESAAQEQSIHDFEDSL